MRKRIVIIGGMGPQASLLLHQKLLEAAIARGARNGEDFPEMLHLSIPVTDFIQDASKMAAAADLINHEIAGIAIGPDDVAAIACNTAHLLVPLLHPTLTSRLVSLIGTSVDSIRDRKLSRVGVVASPTTIRSKLYEQPLAQSGIATFVPSKVEQDAVEGLIRSVIAGRTAGIQQVEAVIERLASRGAQAVLLGCTELSVVFRARRSDVLIDPLDVLANKLIEEYYHEIRI